MRVSRSFRIIFGPSLPVQNEYKKEISKINNWPSIFLQIDNQPSSTLEMHDQPKEI